ncbi:MAG: DivIVA domain-containing protein, partial [Propionibacterium freudenreichii]
MTLSLDEVRSIRFPLARKPNEDGYRASSVDKFMDDLEVSYAQLTEELDKLKQGGAATGSDDAKVSELTSQIEDLTGSNKKLTSDVERLTGENEQLRGQLNELRTSGGRDSAANQQLTTENEHLRNELEG